MQYSKLLNQITTGLKKDKITTILIPVTLKTRTTCDLFASNYTNNRFSLDKIVPSI